MNIFENAHLKKKSTIIGRLIETNVYVSYMFSFAFSTLENTNAHNWKFPWK